MNDFLKVTYGTLPFFEGDIFKTIEIPTLLQKVRSAA